MEDTRKQQIALFLSRRPARIDRFLSSYGLVTIPNIVPTLPEIRQARAAAVEMLIANRTGSPADRVGIFEELLQHSRTLDLAKPDLDKEATLAP